VKQQPSVAGPPAARWDPYRSERFLIVGFSELTGRSVAQVFEEQGLKYKISDLRPRRELAGALNGLSIDQRDIFTGPQTPEQLAGITTVILSPGVPRTIPLVQAARERGIAVFGDIDFLFDLVKDRRIVAITGTDGKTTTTLLTGAVLEKGARTVVAGNVGQPIFSRYKEILECEYLVLEVSSFMLEDTRTFRPNIAAITNVAQDHVDRYGGFEAYLAAKLNILRYCGPEDLFIQNLDDPSLRSCRSEAVRIRTISQKAAADYSFLEGRFHFRGETLAYEECLLRGRHNIENILIALAIGCEAGIDPVHAAAAVRGFGPVPHRFEYLGRWGGVDVYDDSKATTVHAIERALESLPGNVVLIVGGRGKGLDFSPLRRYEAKVKLLMCYGEAGEDIGAALAFVRSDYVFSFAVAVAMAARACSPGDTLLLSPGCTSWDQHVDYNQRGAEFRDLAYSSLANTARCHRTIRISGGAL
jgi:UDP-N-acetylmuramoylalanine--D-glutamate ligase